MGMIPNVKNIDLSSRGSIATEGSVAAPTAPGKVTMYRAEIPPPDGRRDDSGEAGFSTIGIKQILLLLILLAALPLTGCGKRNMPEPLPGEQSQYPRIYPHE